MYKIELVHLYQQKGNPMSSTLLKKLLNKVFYAELVKVGYNKNDKVLSPKVIDKFFELYGKP